MNQELQVVEEKKAAQRSTTLVGDHFPTDVAEIGASTALVSDPLRAMNSLSDLSLLQVQDTLTTPLRKLAPNYRQLMPLRPMDN
jgi:hypothetical protein